jgi:hypothetical protein
VGVADIFRLERLETRIELLNSLPIGSLDNLTLQIRLREIGEHNAAPESA